MNNFNVNFSIPASSNVNYFGVNRQSAKTLDEKDLNKFPYGLPEVNSVSIPAYYPNINVQSKNGLNLDNALKLSNDRYLLRRVVENTGSVKIEPGDKDGEFKITKTSFIGGKQGESTVSIMSEDNLLKDKSLCFGPLNS